MNDNEAVYEYRIRVEGCISPKWYEWFGEMQIIPEENTTLLKGILRDQSAFYGVIDHLAGLNLTIISIERTLIQNSL